MDKQSKLLDKMGISIINLIDDEELNKYASKFDIIYTLIGALASCSVSNRIRTPILHGMIDQIVPSVEKIACQTRNKEVDDE